MSLLYYFTNSLVYTTNYVIIIWKWFFQHFQVLDLENKKIYGLVTIQHDLHCKQQFVCVLIDIRPEYKLLKLIDKNGAYGLLIILNHC